MSDSKSQSQSIPTYEEFLARYFEEIKRREELERIFESNLKIFNYKFHETFLFFHD
jgi:hypothetical protein